MKRSYVIGGVIGAIAVTAIGATAGGVAGNNIQRDLQEDNTRGEIRRECE